MASSLPLSDEFEKVSISSSGEWTRPVDPEWTASDKDEIKQFYKKRVRIEQNEWFINAGHVDHLLKAIFDKLKKEAEAYPGIVLKDFIRQGSSREGLKVASADEYDTVVPFEFEGVTTKVLIKKESQFKPLPPGYAQIELLKIPDEFRKKYPKLIKQHDRKELLDTKYLHDTIFKGMVDKMLLKSDDVTKDIPRRGRSVTYKINRKSSAPAIILETSIIEKKEAGDAVTTKVSIDFVPGYVYDQVYGKPKLLISKWVPESKSVTMATPITDPETTTTIWKLSFYEREVEFIQRRRGIPTSEYLVAAFRILKGLRRADTERDVSSQFASTFSSYYMKNILMYSLLFEPYIRSKHPISSVTEALGCLIGMIRLSMEKKNLPKFFISNPLLKDIYPNDDFHKGNVNTRMDILVEYVTSLPQVRRDFDLALKHFKLEDMSETLKAKALLRYYERHLSAVTA